VKRPGVYEAPLGLPMRELIYELGGGMLHSDRPLKAVIPGGSSVPVLRAEECDVDLDFDALAAKGTMLGSAGLMVMDSSTCMVAAMARIAHFYHHESCGQCTPVPGRLRLARARVESHRGGKRDAADLDLLCRFEQHHRQHDLRAGRRGGDARRSRSSRSSATSSSTTSTTELLDRHARAPGSPLMPKITIDGEEIEVARDDDPPGGVDARPRDPALLLSRRLVDRGNCRMCLVEVEKQPKLVIGCYTPVADGMVVHTQAPRSSRRARR
jgi:hypothetical protein